ncbi:MAG: hypothetical protein AAFV53_03740 [Myxococcota bacterium]
MRHPLIISALFLLFACEGEDPSKATPVDTDDTSAEDSGDVVDGWSIQPVDTGDGGVQGRIGISPAGQRMVVYWNPVPREDGICDEVTNDPPPRIRYELRFATVDSGQWQTELIDEPTIAFTPNGLDLTFDADGVPNVAYTGGAPSGQYCGSNDAYIAERGAAGEWSMTAAATESGQSNTGEPASDAGFVVGLWPSLAFDRAGVPAVLHKDAHFGSLQRDDAFRADMELALGNGGGWDHVAVDIGEGAGDFGQLLFDDQDRPVAVYAVPVDSTKDPRLGYWAARQEADGNWTRIYLHAGLPTHRVAAGFAPGSGELVVAFYSVEDQAARLRRLPAGADFDDSGAWSDELVASNRYDEGRDVSLAFRSDDSVVLAYHRCVLLSDGVGDCNINDEALILAEEIEGGWDIQEVHAVQGQSCGRYASVVVDTDDRAHVAFTCDGNGLYVASEGG